MGPSIQELRQRRERESRGPKFKLRHYPIGESPLPPDFAPNADTPFAVIRQECNPGSQFECGKAIKAARF
jgi:hypothetical protein